MVTENTSKRPIIKAASACVWRGDNVLLVQRGKALGYGFWSLPGGKIETGESAFDAAARELMEEANVVADLLHHVGDFDLDTSDAHYVISCFTGSYVSGEATAMTDAKAVAWVDWQLIGDYRLAFNNAEAVALARKLISL
jgi:ADP-ribose pyrophosphatase YjhB (NUDIX family)